ncbi:P-loop containing nucleoside triphosphate hydrolases superfamily protein [Actinidia rufa]|uniref:Sulfotransferase n=1 Tax=Actinidia rufa TaxID=165716 RepID=A0A7J0EGU5_9ERIC|nr:P-loop containing nucleoside triphosphate hydrolases superfamily protein [Actinidia rufa]
MTARETRRVKEEEYLEETQHNFNEKLQTIPRERGWFGLLFRSSMIFPPIHCSTPVPIVASHALTLISWVKYGIKDLEALPSPRLLATHFPYTLLPEAVTASGSKFVYIWRDPKDVLVSMWQFVNKVNPKEIPPIGLNEAFELFCKGISNFGPFWDHVLGYWKVCQESPNKMLFLKYEDMKREPLVELKKLADFMGHPFTMEEEKDGVVEKIVEFCSFEHLSNLEVNKTGSHQINRDTAIENRHFFRKGQIGESKIHLTSEMMDCIDRITQHKFNGSGLI